MQKKPCTKYYYIEMLVQKIKENYEKKIDYDWYFEELLNLYQPLVTSTTKKICQRFKTRVKSSDIKAKVSALIFDAILRYNPKYTDDSIENTKTFKYVYFSSYLKKFLPWEMYRILKPTNIDYDDLVIDKRHLEFDAAGTLGKDLSQKLVAKVNFNPISENFISLCRYAQKELKSDLLGDVMILHFGYDYKNFEIAEILGITQHQVGIAMLELKKFWQKNKELLIN